MFKNFGNVFRFSFKNAITRGYKILTVIIALACIAVPILIMVISARSKDKGEKSIDACGADIIYVVNDLGGENSDFNTLNMMGEKNYTNIKYVNCASIDEALAKLEDDKNNIELSFILGFEEKNGSPCAYIVVPDKRIPEGQAKNYYDFMDKYESYFMVLAAGLDEEGLRQIITQSEYQTYHETGFKDDVAIEDSAENDDVMASGVLSTFKSVLPLFTLMLLYFLILAYGSSITQSIVMEKSSKLMDTMLVSVRPEALCMGKFLAVALAGIIQMFVWIGSIVLGFVIGNAICTKFYPEANFGLIAFFKAMSRMHVFSIPNVAIAVLMLIVGFLLFASLAVVAGAISKTREEAAGASFLFVLPLLLAYFAVMFGGGLESGGAPTWMLYVPFTAALITPAYVSLGVISFAEGLASYSIMFVCMLLFIVAAGRLYKMMSLYKGNQLKMGKVLKMLFTGESAMVQKK
ncbi:MAG: ABC transporter permease [Eubacterium sp.]|nr:ABC transporter permease [Eubacterium sp.]